MIIIESEGWELHELHRPPRRHARICMLRNPGTFFVSRSSILQAWNHEQSLQRRERDTNRQRSHCWQAATQACAAVNQPPTKDEALR